MVTKKLTLIDILLLVTIFLMACNYEVVLKDGDEHITEEMHELIYDHIIQEYSSGRSDPEKHFEVHKIYGTGETNDELIVYMWSYYEKYIKSRGGLEQRGGHSLPAIIRLSKKEGGYSVIKYKEAEDGNLTKVLTKIFPKKYIELAQKDEGNTEELKKELDDKVSEWLEQEGLLEVE